MQTVSQDYIDLWEGQHRVEVRVKIDREDYPEGYWILQDHNLEPILTSSSANIEVIPFPAADLQEGQLFGVTITGGLYKDERFSIGSCVSREIEVRFLLGDAVIPRMAKIQPEVRLVNDDGDVSEWIPKGTFWLDTRELDKETGIMTIRGYDAMLKGEATYIASGVVGDWPKTMTSVASEIAGLMGLTMDSRNNLDANYMMQLPTDYSMREILGYIAAANAGNWIITDEGKLRLVRVDDTVDSVDLGLSAKTYHIAEPYQEFSKVEIDLSETDYVAAGDDTGRTLEIAIPIVSTTQAQTIAADVLDALDGFIYTPLTADGTILDPAMEIGDAVTVGTTTSVLATQTMRLDSLCASDITAPGEDELDHEYPYESVGQREIKRKISNIETTFTIAVDGITGRVDDLEGEYTEVSQKVDGFAITVTNGQTSSVIKLMSGTTEISSQTIQMSGLVTFTDLSDTASQTFINGANIITGTISANAIKVNTVYAYSDDNYRILSSRIIDPSQLVRREIVNIGYETPSRYNESHIVNHATAFIITDSSYDELENIPYGLYIDPPYHVMTPFGSSNVDKRWTLGGPRWTGDNYGGSFDRIYLAASSYIYVNSSDEFVFRDSNGNDTVLGSSGNVFSQIEFTNGEYITINYRDELIYSANGQDHVFLFAGSDMGTISVDEVTFPNGEMLYMSSGTLRFADRYGNAYYVDMSPV